MNKDHKKKDSVKKEAEANVDKHVRQLRGLTAFEKFSDRDLDRLVRASHHSSHIKPWPLIREQTPSDDCYILLDGEVGVYVGEDRVAVLGPGEVIGESALRQGKLRSATVTTLGPVEVLRIERDDLTGLLDAIPALREAMEAVAEKHVSEGSPAKPPSKPERSTLSASVGAELVERFEKAAAAAGVSVSAALEDALTGWIDQNKR